MPYGSQTDIHRVLPDKYVYQKRGWDTGLGVGGEIQERPRDWYTGEWLFLYIWHQCTPSMFQKKIL